jgi:5-amino-6-(5-phosphoribosylamino)uracil reductase
VRRLLPSPADRVALIDAYPPLPARGGRPSVRVNMIASVDGATAVEGASGGLGGPADRAVFLHLRSLADLVLVGAGTVRAEGYGPPHLPSELQAARRERGQEPLPRLAVVSRSCLLDWDAPVFRDPGPRPIVVTTEEAPAGRRAAASAVADLLTAGREDVDLAAALSALGAGGADAVVAEGGPHLNGSLAGAGLVDELCLTIAPRLVGGDSTRIVAGPALPGGAPLEPAFLGEWDGFLFLRCRRPAPPAG